MIPASSRRGASVVGVSPDWTVNSTTLGSLLAGVVNAGPRSSRTRSDTKPIWSADGLSQAQGTTTARTSGRATVTMTTRTKVASRTRNTRNRTTPPRPPLREP